MKKATILVVDDEKTQSETLCGYLSKQGFNVFEASDGEGALRLIHASPIDVVLSDMRMPKMDGLELLKRIKKFNPAISVVVMTAYGEIADAVQAMKTGAEDFLQKPIDLDQLDLLLKRLLEHRQLVRENELLKRNMQSRKDFSQLIVHSEKMEEILNISGRSAASKATILLRGESGTGKELLARAIHLASPRKGKPFIAVNMAALSENLVESELFGYEKGAFTGASKTHKGRFELAHEGTLFVDEMGDIPLSTQVKLLRVLQEQSFERIGGDTSITTDVRVIAATNRDLESMVQKGAFREDLYYRLNVISIHIPPLRERKEEIPALVDHFIRSFSSGEDKQIYGVSKEAMDHLMKHHYPGNVRELQNMLHRAVVLCRDDVITLDDLSPAHQSSQSHSSDHQDQSLTGQVEALEKRLIREALSSSDGNQSEAARRLGITERNMRYKLSKYLLK